MVQTRNIAKLVNIIYSEEFRGYPAVRKEQQGFVALIVKKLQRQYQ